jgi:hypothetical protein
MGQKGNKRTWPRWVVYLYTNKEIFECTSTLPFEHDTDACIIISFDVYHSLF